MAKCAAQVSADSAWQAFTADVESTFVSLLTISSLFASRDIDLTLAVVKSQVESFTQRPCDATTLETLSAVYEAGVRLERRGNALHFHLTCLGGAPTIKRARDGTPTTEPMRERRSFAMKPAKIGNLPKILDGENVKLRAAIKRYRTKRGKGSVPPPLHEAKVTTAASGASSSAMTTAGDMAKGGSSSALAAVEDELTVWHEGDAVNATNVCSFLRAQPAYRGQLVHCEVSPARPSNLVPISDLPDGVLSAPLEEALRARGIVQLYAHQASALRTPGALVVATPTSSGKSLAYAVPAIQAVIQDPYARALLLFPTKALAQDQLRALTSLADAACPHLYAATLDGDVPKADRVQLATRAHVLLANPDILHACVLPHHADWKEMLSNLKLIAIDEAHACHGVFGSHVALVIRRLRRLCALYGAAPRVICCSATIANPREHAAALTGVSPHELTVVTADGAPAGMRTIGLWNPPKREPSALIEWHERLPPGAVRRRVSNLHEAAALLVTLLTHGLRTLAFVRTRAVAERLFECARDRLPAPLKPKLACYRAGYLVGERRATEEQLFGGALLGVVATNALELVRRRLTSAQCIDRTAPTTHSVARIS